MGKVKFHAECAPCLLQGGLKLISRIEDGEARQAYMAEMCRILARVDPQRDAAPNVHGRINGLCREMFGIEEDYGEIKHRFNGMLLGMYERLEKLVRAEADPLRTAVALCTAGNYIDFGVVKHVTEEGLLEKLGMWRRYLPEEEEYRHFIRDLSAGGELFFLHDKCGEIVLDKLLISQIREGFPKLHIASVVRHSPISNDVTREDAREVGLSEVSDEILTNGVKDLGGTALEALPRELFKRMTRATVIAKGQGNFETLIGCGLNVYYMLLAKCEHYEKWFGIGHFASVFKNDRRLGSLYPSVN